MASLFPDARRPGGTSSSRTSSSRPKSSGADPPPLEKGWVLAHCDGGARGNPGPSGFGAVIVDADGSPLAELSEFLGFRTNNFAEYSGLLAVLAWALEQNHHQLRVVSDSELMVKQVQGKYKVNSPDLRPLFEEARRRIGQLRGFEIFHALRHKNKVADRLANEAMDRGMGKTFVSQTNSQPRQDSPSLPLQKSRQPENSTALTGSKQPELPSSMLRGFVRDGVVHLLGGQRLPENSFVKILPE